MSNYKQVTNIGIETVSSSAHTNETLKAHYQSNDLQTIYFGLKDDNDNYDGNLTESSYTLTSTISGCSATILNIDSSKTAGIITYTVSANTGTSIRRIPFIYNNTTLFTINQAAPKDYIDVYFQLMDIQPGGAYIAYTTDNWDTRQQKGTPVKLELICTTNNTTQTIDVYSNFGKWKCSCSTVIAYKYKLGTTCQPSTRKDTYTSNIKYNFYVTNTNELICHI